MHSTPRFRGSAQPANATINAQEIHLDFEPGIGPFRCGGYD
jgi:hypothetical protein